MPLSGQQFFLAPGFWLKALKAQLTVFNSGGGNPNGYGSMVRNMVNQETWKRVIETRLVFFVALISLPISALGQSFFDFSSFVTFVLGDILSPLEVVIFGLAIAYFLWGITKYILHADDVKERAEGKKMMIYGVIALAVIVSIWGFVNILSNTFQLDGSTLPQAENLIK